MLLISDNPSNDLPGLNVKIPKRPLSTPMLDKDSRPIYKLKQTVTNMLENQDKGAL